MSLLTLYHLTQTFVSAYTGLFSYTSIRKVQTYEEPTQKAAQYSNIAEHHLKTTQSMMAAGAGAVLSSFLSSIYLLTTSKSTSTSTSTTSTPILLSTALAIGLTAAHTHIGNYWRGKMKVPLPKSGDYNDAISTANYMRRLIGGLAMSWGAVAVWYFVLWMW